MSNTSELEKFLIPLSNNKIIYTFFVLFITLYGGLAAPKLPRKIANLFDNEIFRLIIIFGIAYTASKDTSIALMCTMGLLISLNTLTIHKINDKICKSLEIDIKAPNMSNIGNAGNIVNTTNTINSGSSQANTGKVSDSLIKCINLPPKGSQSLPPSIPTPSAGTSSVTKEKFSLVDENNIENQNLENFTLDSPSPFESNGAAFASF